MANTKKLLLLIGVSGVGVICPTTSPYPYLSRHLPHDSLVRRQCEEIRNLSSHLPHKSLGDSFPRDNKEIIARCQNLEDVFPVLINKIDECRAEWIRSNYSNNSIIVLLEKREWVRQYMFTKDNIDRIRENVEIILQPLAISEVEKRQEEECIKSALLIAAEHERD